ncbi:MAG: hypothetical protein ACREON_02095, partial [Gemmatimonadaceae bacterium]
EGTLVVPTAQPYGSFAKALLERQRYPDLREYPGGPPKRPYDVTAHTLPLLMGVQVAAIADSLPPLRSRAHLLSVRVDSVSLTKRRRPSAARAVPSGSGPGPTARAQSASPGDSAAPRVAIYRSHVPSMDEGWTRWVFDRYGVPYVTLVDRDVRAGGLRARFDAIILPDQSPRSLERGTAAEYPDSLRGGLGAGGAAALRAFVEAGGTLIAFNDASNYAIGALRLPVRNVLDSVSARDFYAPGSILQVTLPGRPATGDDLSLLVPDDGAAAPFVRALREGGGVWNVAWFEESPAFEVTDPARATVVLAYPTDRDALLSGWLLGGERLRGRAALVDVRLGEGHVILFGFRPQYRAQTLATYPLIWAALASSGAR